MALPPEEIKPSGNVNNFDYDPRGSDEDKPLGWIYDDPVNSNHVVEFKTLLVIP